ncbi:MAG: methylenetetrahydrofolate reductase [Gammaproteobacteria bacterium]|nr:methylenetetrahydrofolate reductase [Gammaproteobacteria bacterium]
MSRLSESLSRNAVTVTAELNPPKGTDLGGLFSAAESLKPHIAAFNLTDSAASRMTMAPIAVAHLLRDRGIESTLQIAGRDRNRLAIQADMLAAHALGVENLVCMTGDPPSGGDHPDAKAVFDLGAEDILRAASSLEAGKDLAGNALKDPPRFYRGAVTNVAVPDLGKEVARIETKIASGAQFFQTNAVYEPAAFERFMARCESFRVPVLAGIILLKSARQARYMTERIPGVVVPGHLIDELERASDPAETSVRMASDIVREVAPMCHGVHIMAIGWERYIPDVLEAAGL